MLLSISYVWKFGHMDHTNPIKEVLLSHLPLFFVVLVFELKAYTLTRPLHQPFF
jgi:hypothetical protein